MNCDFHKRVGFTFSAPVLLIVCVNVLSFNLKRGLVFLFSFSQDAPGPEGIPGAAVDS